MGDERKLSEVFENIISNLEKEGLSTNFVFNSIDPKPFEEYKMLEILSQSNFELFDRKGSLAKQVRFLPRRKLVDEKDYILNFLKMCELLMNGIVPEINEYNAEKYEQFENLGIVHIPKKSAVFIQGIKEVDSSKIALVRAKYTKIDYKIGEQLNSQYINKYDNSVNINESNITNSTLQINCNFSNENIADIISTIIMLIECDDNIPSEVIDELSENKTEHNNKLVELLKFVGNATKDFAVNVLTEVCVQAINGGIS